MKDLMKLMKQAGEIQERMQKLQEELAGLEVEGQSGAGLVKVKLNGKMEPRSIKIDPSLIKPDEAEMLEDLILAAFQDAKGKAETAVQAKIGDYRRSSAAARVEAVLEVSPSPRLRENGRTNGKTIRRH